MNRYVPPQTMSSREFNQNTGRAKQAADRGPLVITDRGTPAYVLMRYEDFREIAPEPTEPKPLISLYEALHDPDAEDDIDLMDVIPPRTVDHIYDPFEDEAD